jgi:hydroxymethylpyrimidine/phosphomethylpyrimidine kinase
VGGTSTHGTGCTFSAAIAAYLALGDEPLEAITRARAYLQTALLRAPGLGGGHGPLGHSEFAEPH